MIKKVIDARATYLDLGLPGLRAVPLRDGGHVPGQHGARPQPAHPPVVPEGLAVAVHEALQG